MTSAGHDPGAFAVCGIRVDAFDLEQATTELLDRAEARTPTMVHLCNAYVLAEAARDRSYRELLNRGDVNLADGAPLTWIGSRLGFPFAGGRPSGTELVLHVTREGVQRGIGHYLYGATETVVTAMAERLAREAPGIDIVGLEAPPFRRLSDAERRLTVERLRRSGATVVWVGLGTPKQDLAAEWLAPELSAVVVPVGAAFDFLAGAKGRAPWWMRTSGLEWLHRLATEPRRLWKRYLLGNLAFLRCALRSREVLVPPGRGDGGPPS